jgi:hypothetical protein
MNDRIAIDNIEAVLSREQLLPTVVLWNRLEGRPRKQDFSRALRAEVRDPLWMISKQWQVGEFRGDDAGSPIFAKVHMSTAQMQRYKPGGASTRDFDPTVPLEALVEQRPVPFTMQQQPLSLDMRVLMGRQWLKLLDSDGLGSLRQDFIDHYAIDDPDPALRENATVTAHPSVWKHFAALAGRAMDGAKLYFHLTADAGNRAYDGMTVPAADQPGIDSLADKFVAWYEQLFYQPVDKANSAWIPSQLEYQFGVSATQTGATKVLTAEEYYHGRLDWYNLDVDQSVDTLDDNGDAENATSPEGVSLENTYTYSFFPTTIQFDGMPNTRWWTFEDGPTNFGDIKPDTTDLNKLLLMEFGLIYANDWFLVPFQLPVGSLANVEGLAVTNVFGERTWITASGTGQDEQWQRWAMYNLSVKGNADVAADNTLVMLPTVPKIQEGEPFDDIRIVRDEVANMVWGVEKTIPLATGWSKSGIEAATQLTQRYEQILDHEIAGGLVVPEVPEFAAPIRYRLMTHVPENWIPFIPVHIDGNNREIQLQRASMPRVIIGDPNPPEKIKPRTVLLRTGLDEIPSRAYFLHEEEVPRSGVRVTQSYQRTRWHDGRVFTWVGVRKTIGRGEGRSGLAFDRVEPSRRRHKIPKGLF